jgi:hypothetical protein
MQEVPMQIRTKGIPDNVSKAICKDSLRFYGQELLGRRLYKNIKLFVVFEKLPNPINALCQWSDDNHKCREFTIIVNKKLNKKTTLIALAHEMVHVKQYAKGELKDYLRNDKVKWCGKVYCFSKIKYWSSPWEKEAYKKDILLYEQYKQSKK